MRTTIQQPHPQQQQQGFADDFWCLTGLPGGEDFSIDEFFDLPNEDSPNNNNNNNKENTDNNNNKDGSSFLEGSLSLSESQDPLGDSDSSFPDFSPGLAIPVDDMKDLELWSHFMDDSVPEANLYRPTGNPQNKKTGYPVNRVKPVRKSGLSRVLLVPSVVPVKPRSKRSRTARNRSWFESSLSSSSSSSPVSTLLFPPPVQEMGMIFGFGKRSVSKIQKRKPGPVGGETRTGTGDPPFQRQCSHCQATKTPQWRAGPSGPKTLCNACGVRYKSGRLFPEYRPACSPTFSSEVHSNSHRKVLEMRRKKEMSESVTGSTPTVSNS